MTDHGDTPPKPRRRKRKLAPRSIGAIATANETERQEIRRLLRPVISIYCRKLRAGINAGRYGERHAMHLFPRVMGAIGADVEIKVTLHACQELGIADLDEGRALISAARAAQSVAHDREALFDALIDQAERLARGLGKRVVVMNEADEV